MGWDGTGMNCYGMGWDGTEKNVPWTSLAVLYKFGPTFSKNGESPIKKIVEKLFKF